MSYISFLSFKNHTKDESANSLKNKRPIQQMCSADKKQNFRGSSKCPFCTFNKDKVDP